MSMIAIITPIPMDILIVILTIVVGVIGDKGQGISTIRNNITIDAIAQNGAGSI